MNQMENYQIHRLLEKFFEGNTSIEEEKALQNYFASDTSGDTEWRLLKRQFDLFASARDLKFNSLDLESEILQKIEDFEKQKIEEPKRSFPLTRFLVAASISLAVILSGVFILRSKKNGPTDTFADPQLAYAETQKALLFVSQKLNEGMKPLDNINKIKDATGQLKNLEKMDESLGMLNLVSFINHSSNLKK